MGGICDPIFMYSHVPNCCYIVHTGFHLEGGGGGGRSSPPPPPPPKKKEREKKGERETDRQTDRGRKEGGSVYLGIMMIIVAT